MENSISTNQKEERRMGRVIFTIGWFFQHGRVNFLSFCSLFLLLVAWENISWVFSSLFVSELLPICCPSFLLPFLFVIFDLSDFPTFSFAPCRQPFFGQKCFFASFENGWGLRHFDVRMRDRRDGMMGWWRRTETKEEKEHLGIEKERIISQGEDLAKQDQSKKTRRGSRVKGRRWGCSELLPLNNQKKGENYRRGRSEYKIAASLPGVFGPKLNSDHSDFRNIFAEMNRREKKPSMLQDNVISNNWNRKRASFIRIKEATFNGHFYIYSPNGRL